MNVDGFADDHAMSSRRSVLIEKAAGEARAIPARSSAFTGAKREMPFAPPEGTAARLAVAVVSSFRQCAPAAWAFGSAAWSTRLASRDRRQGAPCRPARRPYPFRSAPAPATDAGASRAARSRAYAADQTRSSPAAAASALGILAGLGASASRCWCYRCWRRNVAADVSR